MPVDRDLNGARWTDADDRLLTDLWETEAPLSRVADALRRTISAVRQRGYEIGLPARGSRIAPLDVPAGYGDPDWTGDDPELRRQWAEGVDIRSIARRLGRPLEDVGQRVFFLRLPRRDVTYRRVG